MIEQNGRRARRKAARKRTALRRSIIGVVALAVAITLWIWVFPWVDREWVNNPNVGF